MDDEEVLDWLTDPDNMESADHIERVNRKMFERILKRSDFVGVFFCKTTLFLLFFKWWNGLSYNLYYYVFGRT